MEPIRLKFTETVTNKLNNEQQVTGSITDQDDRPIVGVAGMSTQLTQQGRILTISVNVFDHEIHAKEEVVEVREVQSSDQQ